MRSTHVVYVIFAFLTAACGAARRPYEVPQAAVPEGWSRDATVEARPEDTDALAHWWTTFDDPVLTGLIDRAVDANLDLRTAISRVREARAQAAGARADLFPSVDGSASASGSRSVEQSYALGLDASWEMDVFGGTHSAIDAAVATAQARGADLQDVLVSTAADTAIQYIRVRSLQERIGVAEANARAQEEAYEIAGFRLQAGLTTDLDVQQARSNLESTRAQIASLQLDASQAMHALATLLGGTPSSLNEELARPAAIPDAPIRIALGVPAEAIRRRPDVRGAELRLAAQSAQVDAARADLYPRFRLTGSIGLETLKLASLFVPGSGVWRGGPSLSVPVFNRGEIRQNILVRTELQTQALVDYESTVLTALQEVEDALVAYAQEQTRRARLADAAAAAQNAADLSLQLYNSGLRDFRDVLDAQRSLLALQDQLVSSRSNVSTEVVRLYRSLGGGWSALTTP